MTLPVEPKPKYNKKELEEFDDTHSWSKDKGFYGHMTHKSLQKQEDSVTVIGDGFGDACVPKTPKTDKFYP